MSVAPWEFINNVQTGSTSLEGYDTFLTNRTLSSNPYLFEFDVFEYINSLEWSSVPSDIRATITANIIRTAYYFKYRYIKTTKMVKDWQDEDIQMVMLRVGCSEQEAKTYISEGFIKMDLIEKWKKDGYYK